MFLNYQFLDLGDRLRRVEALGTDARAVEDGVTAIEAERILEIVGLHGRALAYPAEVNLHERQLLEMARALATRPRVLLLDEVLAGLTPAEADVAVDVIRRIHETGVTLVVIEHVLRIVNQLAERIVVLDQGLVIADGEPAAVMRHPEVVRAYLGPGHAGTGDGTAVHPGSGTPADGAAAVEAAPDASARPVDGSHADA